MPGIIAQSSFLESKLAGGGRNKSHGEPEVI
jgi:hypothetical protein